MSKTIPPGHCQVHCPPGKARSGAVVALARAAWWLLRQLPKLAPVFYLVAWVLYVWLSGRTWQHRVPHRWVRREVRAAGNWAATAVAALLVWRPVATAVALGLVGFGILLGIAAHQRRAQIAEHIAARAARRQDEVEVEVEAEVEVLPAMPPRPEITAQPEPAEHLVPASVVLDTAELHELTRAPAMAGRGL